LPVHAVGATGPQITETNGQCDANLAAYMCCKEEEAALWKQILTAVNTTFLVALKHKELGHIAMPQAMLAHLKEEYGKLDATEIETNHATLAGAWNPDNHIEDLFTRIHDAQCLAAKANEPITDVAAIRLTITALENTGVFESGGQNHGQFQKHFCTKNKACVAKLTAQTTGYHDAHAASIATPSVSSTGTQQAPHPVINAVTAMTPLVLTDDSVRMYYCWSHGLRKNKEHTSRTCQWPKEGHCETATANNMMGGNNTIGGGCACCTKTDTWDRGKPIDKKQSNDVTKNLLTQPICNLVAPVSNSVGPPAPKTISVMADTGSTAHFCTFELPVINKWPTLNPISIRNANGSIMHSTHDAELDMHMLPAAAKWVHIVPELATHMLSIGQLCDARCDVAFTAEEITIKYKGNTVLSGHRTCHTRWWHFSMPSNLPSPKKVRSPTEHASMTAIRSARPAQLVVFAHATLFSPALSTLGLALNKGYLTISLD
jgi:hypothetical protein